MEYQITKTVGDKGEKSLSAEADLVHSVRFSVARGWPGAHEKTVMLFSVSTD